MSREPSQRLIAEELIDQVNSALDHLDFDELLILRYYVLDDLKLSEISERLNKSPSTTRRILQRSLKKLRRHLGKKFSDEEIVSIIDDL